MAVTYISILENIYQARKNKNKLYSKRAFARDLKIPPSTLAEILDGKSELTLDRANAIIKLIEIDNETKLQFINSVQDAENKKSIHKKIIKEKRKKLLAENFEDLHIEYCKIIAEWYHYAILELISIPNSKSDLKWIAAKLDITEKETKQAIERLIKVKLLRVNENNKYEATNDFTAGADAITEVSIRKHHIGLLQKAMLALQEQDINTRDISSITMAFESGRMKLAKEKIRKFRRMFNKDLSKYTDTDSVYALNIQFIKLNK